MRVGFAGRVAHAFLDSKLTPLVIVASLGLGALALLATPREEEPQIRVPMVDVMVAWPGAEPAEVENRVVAPIERILWGVPGVEHIYSVVAPRHGDGHRALQGQRVERGRASSRSTSGRARWAGSCRRARCRPIVELHSIDDVPFLTLTLWGGDWSSDRLRPLAAELAQELSEIPETSRVQLIGGQPRVVRVEPDPDRMAAAGVSWTQLTGALQAAVRAPGGRHRRARQPRDARRGGAALPELGRGRPRGRRRAATAARVRLEPSPAWSTAPTRRRTRSSSRPAPPAAAARPRRPGASTRR